MAEPPPIAIVTGSSRGIGLAIARALGAAGYRLLLAARDEGRLAAAQAQLRAAGASVATIAVELRARDAAARVVAAARGAFGEPEVLIHNAGTAPTAKVTATDDAMLDETLDLHVRAPLRLLREVLPAMQQRQRGCIVQMASSAGLRGFPFTAAYTAAKHGMVGLARALHAELRTELRAELRAELRDRGIHCYAVCPGFVDTDITRQAAARIAARGRIDAAEALRRLAAQNRIGRMHTADEVAAAVAMLVRERPAGCVYDLDHDPPRFVDEDQGP